MHRKGKLLILLAGTLSFIGANSHLLDNGDSTVGKESESRFVLLIDNSDSMSSHHRMDHVHNNAIRWITQLKPGTMVTIIKFGSSWSLVHDWVDPSMYQRELIQAINSIQPNGGGCNMASGLEIAQQKLLELEHGDKEGGVVMAFTTGEINEGADVGNEGIWGILLYYSIKVTSILMGARINAGIETLSKETQGKVFSVNYDGSNIDGPFDWASQTWMSTYVVDNYDWMISDQVIPGVHQVACDSTSHLCFHAQLDLDDQIINDITITIRLLKAHDENPPIDDYIELVHVEDPDSGDVIGGWKYSVDSFTNKVTLENSHPDAGQYRIVVSLKKRVSVQFVLQVKVTGHNNSPEYLISNQAIPGRSTVPCDSTAHQCFHAQLDLDDQIINDITITIRLQEHNGDPNIDDYIELVHVEDPDSGDVIGGWNYFLDSFTNQVTLRNSHPDAGQYRIVVSLKKRVNVLFVLQVKVTGHKYSPNAEPYVVTCQYPRDLKDVPNEYLITGQVKRGNAVVKGATVAARVSISMDADPSGMERSCYFYLRDDGLQQYSGDLRAFDGVHSYIMDPRMCFRDFDLVERMQVMCTMVPSTDGIIDEHNFFS